MTGNADFIALRVLTPKVAPVYNSSEIKNTFTDLPNMQLSRRRFMTAAGVLSLAPAISFQAKETFAQASDPPAGKISVGVGSVDITCEPGPDLAGFLARIQPSTGIKTHLFSRALFLHHGTETMLWLSVDSLGFTPEIVERVKASLSEKLGIEPWRVVVMATHTHSAPSASKLSSLGDYNDHYVETILIPGMIKSAEKAKAAVEDCSMVEATGEIDVSYDRRNKPTKHTEKRVPAIAWKRDDGSFKAALIGYTMHPTCYAKGDISAEWPGATADAVREMFSADTEPFIIQGACGNINYPTRNISDEEMKQLGGKIAGSVVDLLKKAEPTEPYFAIRARRIAVLLDVPDKEGVARFVGRHRNTYKGNIKALKACDLWESWADEQLLQNGTDHIETEVAAIVIGRRAFVSAPFETLSWMNLELAKHTKIDCFAMGYTNGCYNYLPHDAAYDEGGYSPDNAHLWYKNFRCKRGELERLAANSTPVVELAAEAAGLTAPH